MNEPIVLHGVTGPAGSDLETMLADGLRPVARLRPIVGSFDRIVVHVSGPDGAIDAAGAGLPEGAARAEALAVRLTRRGFRPSWGEPNVVTDVQQLLELCRARGRSSVDMMRADRTLTTELQAGGWFDAGYRMRLLRRIGVGLTRPQLRLRFPRTTTFLEALADLAFWRGVRDHASDDEWRRLTVSSYVALVYHRLAGELKAGQETIDLAPSLFERQLRLLRLLRFCHLRPDELVGLHERPDATLPRRSFAVTLDDGLLDCVAPLARHADSGMQLFVPTREVGGRAHWLDHEPVMSWDDVRSLAAAGVAVGAHARHHRRLTGLEPSECDAEVAGALEDLRAQLDSPLELIAYPHGDHDAEVRRAAREAGYRAAFTTQKGRNGVGTDPFCLRRISVHGTDGALAVLWKVVTGESLPRLWLRLRSLALRKKRGTQLGL